MPTNAETTPSDGVEHLSLAERTRLGKAARKVTPLDSQAELGSCDGRDPVAVLAGEDVTRVPELVPIRYGRMLATPLTFFRGAAVLMAERPRLHPGVRLPGADLRRRAPVELRHVRLRRAHPGVRHQRLRRDPPGPLGVGRQAPRGELRGG
nr:hypothetical protein GCM10020092_064070 [Actinoplanes digitatis]